MTPIEVLQLDHTSIAVESIPAALRLFRNVLGGEMVAAFDPGSVPYADVQLRYPNGAKVELVTPRGPGFMRSFLDTRGEGVHHLTFFVRDLTQAIETARSFGHRVVDENRSDPSWLEAFISPRSAFGTIVQLAQVSRAPGSAHAPAALAAGIAVYDRPAAEPDERVGVFRFDHTALAMRDMDAGIRFFGDCLGGRLVKYSCDPDRAGCVLRFANGSCVELMEPLISGTFLQRFLDTRGEGVHHLTFMVRDLRAAIAGLRAAGYALSGEDFRDPEWSEVFISPRHAHGTVVQLVQTTRTHEQLETGHPATEIEDARRRHALVRRRGGA